MELKFTKRLTFCVACCCIMYWTSKWFWVGESAKSFQDTTQ